MHHTITHHELDSYVRYVVAFDSLAYPDSAEAACLRHPSRPACRALRDQALRRLLQERLVQDYAGRHGVRLDGSDTQAIQSELDQLQAPASPTARLFKDGTVNRRFMRSVLARQVLVQKVQSLVAGERAIQGPAVRIRRIRAGFGSPAQRGAVYHSLLRISSGGPVPADAEVHTRWVAAFRIPAEMRRALDGAHPGEYVGPFERHGALVMVQLLARGTHAYGTPARSRLVSQYFNSWISQALQRARPRCIDRRQELTACPSRIVNAA